ncbi:MAG TPA: hypothetical protein VGP82_21105 [Ktedonobacterales bacterium]|nr:hypothetical protein [Ktedonobacterales bacterium]
MLPGQAEAQEGDEGEETQRAVQRLCLLPGRANLATVEGEQEPWSRAGKRGHPDLACGIPCRRAGRSAEQRTVVVFALRHAVVPAGSRTTRGTTRSESELLTVA